MVELRKIETAPGFLFDALAGGPVDAPLVLMLHGFAESMHTWEAQVVTLAQAGYHAIAPNQRGYSPGARPDPTAVMSYHLDRLVEDAVNLAAVCGYHAARFHLVGHDRGGSIAWGLADRHPDRLASLTVLSRPHPSAFNRALQMPDSDQAHRSRHHQAFLQPDAGPRLLAEGARRLRERLVENGVPSMAIERRIAVLGNEATMEAALAWYRAPGAIRAPLGAIKVPTLYIWGDADDTVGSATAAGTTEFVPPPINSKSCQVSVILLPTRPLTGSTSSYCLTSPNSPSRRLPRRVTGAIRGRELISKLER
jgi:pimeloyl-ACP methyl ester carboxylesterase